MSDWGWSRLDPGHCRWLDLGLGVGSDSALDVVDSDPAEVLDSGVLDQDMVVVLQRRVQTLGPRSSSSCGEGCSFGALMAPSALASAASTTFAESGSSCRSVFWVRHRELS